jgi:hypothetical protein
MGRIPGILVEQRRFAPSFETLAAQPEPYSGEGRKNHREHELLIMNDFTGRNTVRKTMDAETTQEITRLLLAWRAGDQAALNRS